MNVQLKWMSGSCTNPLAPTHPLLNDVIKAGTLIEGVICYLSYFSESRYLRGRSSLICRIASRIAACILTPIKADSFRAFTPFFYLLICFSYATFVPFPSSVSSS